MKSKGFTLIELLAVILILGIIALIAIPTVNGVVESAKKSALETTTISTIKGAEDACVLEKLQGQIITNKHYINDYKSNTLNIKNLPKEGMVTVDDNCSAYAALTDGKYYATGTIDSVDISNEETKYEEITSLVYTKDSCFIFDKDTRTITGYNYEREDCGKDIGIPSEIDNVPVEHIGDNAFYITKSAPDKIYIALTSELTRIADYNIDLINKFVGDPDSIIYYSTDISEGSKVCYYYDEKGTSKTDTVSLDFIPEDDKYYTCVIYGIMEYASLAYIKSVDFRAAVNLQTIGENAFRDNDITSIKFGKSNKKITSIGKNAFSNNKISGELDLSMLNLKKIETMTFEYNLITTIKFPNNLEYIGINSFAGNDALTDLVIPEGVTSIGANAFFGCDGLNTVTLPSSVKTLNARAFSSCKNLSRVILPEGISIGFEAFSTTNISDFTVPNNSTLDKNILYHSPVTKLTLGDNLILNKYALGNTSSVIDTLKIPGSMVNVPEYAFYGTKINNLVFEDGTVSIGSNSFRTSSIKNIKWNSTIKTLGSYCFYGSALKEIVIPSTVKTIPSNAYYNNSATGVTLEIPSTVTSISSTAFGNNYFSSVKINKPNTSIGINASAFKCGNASRCAYTINVDAAEGTIANAPWGNTYATINYLK